MKSLLIVVSLAISLLSFNTHAVYAKITACEESICKDYFKTYKKYARMGYAEAMVTLGELYYYGYGTDRNVKKALKQYRNAAKYGSVKGQYNAAMIYINEEQFKDIDEGVKYLKKAARNNNVGSAFLLGMIYFSPDFYQQDFDEADKWLTEAYEKSFKQLPKFIDHMKKTEHFTAANFPDLFDAIEEAPGLLEQPIILAAKAKATKASVQAQVEPDAPDSAQQRTITSAPENENLGDTEVITVVGRLTDLFDIQIASLKNAYPEKGGQSTGTKIIGRSCAETLSCGYANSQAFNQAIDNIAGSAAISSFY